MQFIVIASLIASVFAVPADVAPRNGVCQNGGLYTSPQCCSADVLDVACLSGGGPPEPPSDANNFRDICGRIGKQAKCCVLAEVANQDVLCIAPV
ncbi:hypothetical protein LMH87_010578 [Akanthomyces muscarius]|uniref:Hydrophobin n=1 Tax=Akanthomyces muscarius TaxID=2231603 RepID=A0A9W8QDK4_AKAMU|nr:hypothetical protein LMH87_010578 [Akanthomyces muscarius]KAJ4154115.1 hypothetical protein LMH87_010578 [Akanthomyces muscarius]